MTSDTALRYLSCVAQGLFCTLPAAIFKGNNGWKWLVADLARKSFEYSSMLRVPIASPTDLYSGINQVKISIPAPRPALKYSEIITLGSLVKFLNPINIFEFGTFLGGGTLLLAANSADNATIHTLDLMPDDPRVPSEIKNEIGAAFKDSPFSQRIHQHFGDSQEFDFTPFKEQMHLIFIDAGHDYNSVKSDTENALTMISPTGIIVWHDFPSALGVRRFLMEFAVNHRVFLLRNTRMVIFDPQIGNIEIDSYWGWK